MKMSEQQRITLLAKLEAKGWYWKNEFIQAPFGSIWLRGSDPWVNNIPEFHTRMAARLGRLLQHKAAYSDERRFKEIISDTAILVYVLRWMVASEKSAA